MFNKPKNSTILIKFYWKNFRSVDKNHSKWSEMLNLKNLILVLMTLTVFGQITYPDDPLPTTSTTTTKPTTTSTTSTKTSTTTTIPSTTTTSTTTTKSTTTSTTTWVSFWINNFLMKLPRKIPILIKKLLSKSLKFKKKIRFYISYLPPVKLIKFYHKKSKILCKL